MKKRNMILGFLFTFLLILLCVRIFYLQVYMGKKLSISATTQKISNSEIHIPRGEIFDRNLIPLTNRTKKTEVLLKPLYLRGKDEEIKELSKILGVNPNEISRKIDIIKEPLIIEIDTYKKKALQDKNIQGISFVNSLRRYDKSSIAKHILGYLNKVDMTGDAGIEKSYEEILKTDSKSSVAVITDAKNNLLQGLGYRFIEPLKTEKQNVKLTIDYHIQKTAEEVMENNNLTGAVVIEDVLSGDIVAMVSTPDYDQNNVEKYLTHSQKALFNRAVASYNLGSIFKIVDLVAAYSTNTIPQNYYFCPGYVVLGDKEFRCSAFYKGGHGLIALEEAFASSCNPYFIELGIQLGEEKIIGAASILGLGSPTGLGLQGIQESSGNLPPSNNHFTYGDIANLSIGQGDVLATPLQVADMIATIANGGIKNKINLIDSIIDSDGNTIKKIREDNGHRIIRKDVCDNIKLLMEKVISSGTGTKANLDEYGGAGGKTGSAETGQYINGEKVVHAWFAGYFPKLNPKYSISVFIEDGKSGGSIAAPVFEEIAKNIMKKKY